MFKQFKTKPNLVEAVQWDGSVEMGRELAKIVDGEFYENTLIFLIHDPDGDRRVSPGDWVIRGVNNFYYPCKPDTFATHYEKAEKPKETKPAK